MKIEIYFFPKLSENLNLIKFSDIAVLYLKEKGLKPFICDTEEQARTFFDENNLNKEWPCLFTKSDTSGEKDFEEFFTQSEKLDLNKFEKLGIIKNELNYQDEKLLFFEKEILKLKRSKTWDKEKIKDLFNYMIPDFGHKETGKFLDSKM